MKKLLSLTLAMAMALSLSLASVSAANSDLDTVPLESAVQPRAPLCPQCNQGFIRLNKTVLGNWVSLGVGKCVCPLFDNQGSGAADEVFIRTIEKYYKCDTCIHQYRELDQETKYEHLGKPTY